MIFSYLGNSGALMAGALFIVGRVKGVDRPAIALLYLQRKEWLIIDATEYHLCLLIIYSLELWVPYI